MNDYVTISANTHASCQNVCRTQSSDLGPESKRETILFDVFILVFSVSDEIDVGKTFQL